MTAQAAAEKIAGALGLAHPAARPRYAIPCHFWTFAEHGAADPGGYLHACRYLCPETQALLLRPGERFVVQPAKQSETPAT